jgi:hypothetical protein
VLARTKPVSVDLAKQPLFLRGTMSYWGTDHLMVRKDAYYQVRINLPAGTHSFKLGSANWGVDLGVAHVDSEVKIGQAVNLIPAGGNLSLSLTRTTPVMFVVAATGAGIKLRLTQVD